MHSIINKEKINKYRRFNCIKYFSPKNIVNNLNNLKDKQVDELFEKLESSVDGISADEFKNIYKDNFIGIRTCKAIINKNNMMKKQGIGDMSISSIDELRLNNNTQNKYIELSKKIANKMAKIIKHPVTKTIIVSGLAIAWVLMYRNFVTATVACFSKDNMAKKIDDAFYYVRMITAVVAFIWMCLELSNTAVKGDMRAIWYIVSKYVVLIIAIVGYKSIFNLIDGFFNG